MHPDADAVNPDAMEEEARESIRKVRQMVEEHGETIKDDAEPPLFYPKH
jgi:hypothetical protein